MTELNLKNNTISCPICKSDKFNSFRFGLLICQNCKIIVNSKIFIPGIDLQLNREAFDSNKNKYISFWVRLFEKWKNKQYLDNIKKSKINGKRMLEIGIGSGSFLCEARNSGFEVMGCELSKTIANQVEKQTGIKVHCGDISTLNSEKFDIVCMHHVLEHVANPIEFLKNVKNILNPGGIIHIAVPNIDCWEAKFNAWNYYVYHHLIRNFPVF